uniref:Uncharacterized protein n=1 Tax=Dendroctonus ponderosae TaxID=77166 RepID=A0AAR5QC40_DENPD
MTDAGFVKGQSDNLSLVDMFMVASYIKNTESFTLAEVRGVKANRSGRYSYGDSAVGWVQVRRDKNLCTVKAKVTPEHNVREKQYAVSCSIDEECEKVLAFLLLLQ